MWKMGKTNTKQSLHERLIEEGYEKKEPALLEALPAITGNLKAFVKRKEIEAFAIIPSKSYNQNHLLYDIYTRKL